MRKAKIIEEQQGFIEELKKRCSDVERQLQETAEAKAHLEAELAKKMLECERANARVEELETEVKHLRGDEEQHTSAQVLDELVNGPAEDRMEVQPWARK